MTDTNSGFTIRVRYDVIALMLSYAMALVCFFAIRYERAALRADTNARIVQHFTHRGRRK